ncbi:MAG: GH3 auxin-responsive promoter family protein [Bacteroidota bacterium]
MISDWINSLFKNYLKFHEADLQAHYKRPLHLQQQEFMRLMGPNANTIFGKQYDFRSIKDQETFAARVPVHSYDDLWPYIEKIIAGESDVLTTGKVNWLAKTAGTTSGTSKYIPIPRNTLWRCHFKAAWYTLATLYAHHENMRIFAQRNLLIGGGVYGKYQDTNINLADVSGIIIHSIPLLLRPFYYPDIPTATLPDYEEKIQKTAAIAARQRNITMLGGVPTWNLSLYRLILEKTGADNLVEIWPDLQAYIHGGVRFEPYRKQFEALIPKSDFLYHEVYNASEGYFAIQDQLAKNDLLLLLNNAVFYEFLTLEDYQEGQYAAAIRLDQVQAGIPYVMLITTNAGLYRYVIGDVITFTEVFPFRIKITGRVQEYINAFGEDLQQSQVEQALISACRQTQAVIRDYSIAPQYVQVKEKGRHQWFIEFAVPPSDLTQFAELLDQAMRRENSNYDQKRARDFAIQQLEVILLPKGFFQAWLKETKRLGGQAKVPKLVNNRKIAESLIEVLAKTHTQTQRTASQSQ